MTATATPPNAVDAAATELQTARAHVVDLHAKRKRLAERHPILRANVTAAEQAAVTAAASLTPDDDADTITALAEARTRYDATTTALAECDEAITKAEQQVAARTRALGMAHAGAELTAGIERVPAFEQALDALLAASTAIEAHVLSAKQHAGAAGMMLNVSPVIGRRILHVLRGAQIDLRDGPVAVGGYTTMAAVSAVRGALVDARGSI